MEAPIPLRPNEELEEQRILSTEGKLPLFMSPDHGAMPDEYITITDDDPIFATSYEMLIKECFRDNKHFILAKMQTRSVTSYQ